MINIHRPEHPNPQSERANWLNLNGEWDFEFDFGNSKYAAGILDKAEWEKKIIVPFSYQYKESGIGDSKDHTTLWYRRIFNHYEEKKNVILN